MPPAATTSTCSATTRSPTSSGSSSSGPTRVVDWEYEDDADYVVLTDPDGNRFCIVQV